MATLTGSASTSFNDTLTGPDDGVTLRNVASVNGPFQALIDNDKILENKTQLFHENVTGAGSTNASGASYIDVHDINLGTLAIGDKVHIQASWNQGTDAGGADVTYGRLAIEENGTTVPSGLYFPNITSNVFKYIHAGMGYTITAAGTAKAKLQLRYASGSNIASIDVVNMTVIVQKAT